MSNIINNNIYIDELEKLNVNNNLNIFNNKTVLITGASGMIGSCLIDTLLYNKELNVRIIGLMRNLEKAKERFSYYEDDSRLSLVECDINKNIELSVDKIDYIFHLASNTHPVQYSTMPIDTIMTNIIGTYNILNLASNKKTEKVIFTSSVEVYGKANSQDDIYDESYCGYIDCNTLRAGYPEAKRTAEALVQAFIKEKNLNIVIARLSRVFGSTMKNDDSKASSQFIKNGINNENIILKSKGNQYYSYTYTPDVISALIFLLNNGKTGEAYNVSNPKCDVTLKEFATTIAKESDTNVIFDIPNETEKAGFSTAINAILDNKKLTDLGWKPEYDFNMAIQHTLKILRKNNHN